MRVETDPGDPAPFDPFGINTVLCEGASHVDLRQHLESGRVLARSLGAFYGDARKE